MFPGLGKNQMFIFPSGVKIQCSFPQVCMKFQAPSKLLGNKSLPLPTKKFFSRIFSRDQIVVATKSERVEHLRLFCLIFVLRCSRKRVLFSNNSTLAEVSNPKISCNSSVFLGFPRFSSIFLDFLDVYWVFVNRNFVTDYFFLKKITIFLSWLFHRNGYARRRLAFGCFLKNDTRLNFW